MRNRECVAAELPQEACARRVEEAVAVEPVYRAR